MGQAELSSVHTESDFALFYHVLARPPSLTPDGFMAGLRAFWLLIIRASLFSIIQTLLDIETLLVQSSTNVQPQIRLNMPL